MPLALVVGGVWVWGLAVLARRHGLLNGVERPDPSRPVDPQSEILDAVGRAFGGQPRTPPEVQDAVIGYMRVWKDAVVAQFGVDAGCGPLVMERRGDAFIGAVGLRDDAESMREAVVGVSCDLHRAFSGDLLVVTVEAYTDIGARRRPADDGAAHGPDPTVPDRPPEDERTTSECLLSVAVTRDGYHRVVCCPYMRLTDRQVAWLVDDCVTDGWGAADDPVAGDLLDALVRIMGLAPSSNAEARDGHHVCQGTIDEVLSGLMPFPARMTSRRPAPFPGRLPNRTLVVTTLGDPSSGGTEGHTRARTEEP